MPTPFINRVPTSNETLQFQLAMSSFCDGSGQEREKNGTTRPGWRDLERIVAELLGGFAPENKEIFDVVVPSNDEPNLDYGISLKSKELSRVNAITELDTNGRVYMEIANSPAKFWAALREKNISEDDYRNKRQPDIIGNTILDVIENWHHDAMVRYNALHSGRTLNLEKSIYLTISYGRARNNEPRLYQLHSFDLKFPKGIVWKYKSEKCLRGYDPDYPDEALIDWYALSGGQLKYYPRASMARYKTGSFQLITPKIVSIIEKTSIYWPQEWISAGGKVIATDEQVNLAEEILEEATK